MNSRRAALAARARPATAAGGVLLLLCSLAPPWARAFSPVPGYDEKASASELLQQTLARDRTLSVSVASGGSPSLFETVTVNCRSAAGCSRAKAVALRSLMEPYINSALAARESDGNALSMVFNGAVAARVLFDGQPVAPQPLPKEPAAAAALVKTAFTYNPLFVRVGNEVPPKYSIACEPKPGPYAVFASQVVQHRCPQMGAGCQVRQGTSNCNVVASDAFERVFRLSGLGVPAVTVDAKAPVVQLQEQPRQAVTAESSAGGGKRPVIAP